MSTNVKGILAVLVCIAAVWAVQAGFHRYREHVLAAAAGLEYGKIRNKTERDTLETPVAEVTPQQANVQSTNKLTPEADRRKRLNDAAANFLGFYLLNVRVRPDYCKGQGVDIASFVNTFKSEHESELARARAVLGGISISEEEYYNGALPRLRKVVNQDMNDIATARKLTIKQTCEEIATNGAAIAAGLHISKVQPAIYQVLTGG